MAYAFRKINFNTNVTDVATAKVYFAHFYNITTNSHIM